MTTKQIPQELGKLILGFRAAKILFTALEKNLFTQLDLGTQTSDQIAQRFSFNKSTSPLFLDSLTALGFLSRTGDRYGNSRLSKRYLVRRSPLYVGDNLKYQAHLWNAWSDISYVLRNGRPRLGLEDLLPNHAFSESYIRGMDNIAQNPARDLARQVSCRPHDHLLDIGSGAGTYSVAFLKRNPKMTATLFDVRSSLRHARQFIAQQPKNLRDRIQFKSGDYHSSNFGTEVADVALLSHVTHDEGERNNLRILRKVKRALRPGGIVIIHDFMLDSVKSPSIFNALFSMHLRTYTRQGRVYSEKEYTNWLNSLDFKITQYVDIDNTAVTKSRAIIAKRD